MKRLGLGIGTALLVGGALAPYGCGSGKAVAESSDGGDSDVLPLHDTGLNGGDTGVLGPVGDDGWQPFLGYPGCSFSVPATKAALPAPPTWEDCPTAFVGQPGVQCREVSLYPDGSRIGGMRAWVHDGKTTLLSTIVTGVPSLLPWVVWDVDGPLITGIRENDDTCALNDALGAVNDGRWILSVRDSRSGTFSDFSTGIVAGNIDDLAPHVAMQFTEKEAPALAVSGALGIIEQTGGPLRLLDWNDPTKRTVLPSDAFAQNFAFTFGSALFWGASGSDYNTQKIYTAEAGAKDFILGGNSPPAAADLATDGTDFAWTEGSGGWTSEGLPTTVNVMTAPFTTDHTKLKPRRLRSEQTYGFGTTPFVVGCGYAMRGITVAMRIVRLSDGVSWLLNKTANWTWETGVAINCAEAFIDVIELPAGRRGKTDGGGLVRIRLDSLGPGIAPD